jgi:hypothetical protein
MKTIQGVYRNGKIEPLEEFKAENNAKLLIVVTDEKVSEDVAPNVQGLSVLEKVRRRSHAEVSTEQQVSSREKLKQIATSIGSKLPQASVDDAMKSLRRPADDHD